MSLENAPYKWSDLQKQIVDLTWKLNACINGGGNNTGDVTLTASAATTEVEDTRVSVDSAIVLMPTTVNAAAALATTYITTDKGSFTITHASNSQTDRTFKYAVIGA